MPPGVAPASGSSLVSPALANLLRLGRGRRTHLVCVLALGLLFGSWQGWWQIPQIYVEALGFIALGFLRSSVSSAVASANQSAPT